MQHLTIINSLYIGLDVCLSVSVIVTEFNQVTFVWRSVKVNG